MNTTEAEKDWLRRISGQKPSDTAEKQVRKVAKEAVEQRPNPNPVRRFHFKNLDIECVKAYCMDYPNESLVPYLRLLDAIKDMKRIPGTTGQDIYNRVKSQYFNGYSLPEL